MGRRGGWKIKLGRIFFGFNYMYLSRTCCVEPQRLSPFWVRGVWYHIYGIIHLGPKTGLTPVCRTPHQYIVCCTAIPGLGPALGHQRDGGSLKCGHRHYSGVREILQHRVPSPQARYVVNYLHPLSYSVEIFLKYFLLTKGNGYWANWAQLFQYTRYCKYDTN